MKVKWNDKEFDPSFLAKRLEELKTKDNTGGVVFGGFETEDILAVINSSVKFPRALPEVQKRDIIRAAIFAAAKKELSHDSILDEIKKQEREYFRRSEQPFVLLTSLSVSPFSSLKSKEVSGCRITFGFSLPQFFNTDKKPFNRDKIRNTVRHHLVGDLPSSYTTVRVSARARSGDEAVETALDAIDLLRGIWNLFFNWPIGIRMSSGRKQPVNSILLGPLHTLHEPDGSLALERFWYDPEYVGPIPCKNLQQDWEQLQQCERDVRKKLRVHRYRHDMEKAIRWYVRALDSSDWNNSFLRLWSLLEFLTATEQANYAQTLQRVLFLYDDTDFHRQILKHLRTYRNQTVHTGSETQEIETLLHQLRRYVEYLLKFHLANRFGFAGLAETAQFLDHSVDLPSLQRKLHITKSAIRFRSS